MKKKKITVAVISVISALTLMLGIVPSLARYVTERGIQSKVVSENFYFTSDYLSEYLSESEIPEHKIYGDSVLFEIRNFIDRSRFNASAIAYTVTAPGGTLTKGGTPTDGDTLTGGSMTRDTIMLTYSGEEAEKEITVTVTSSSPYVKELKAKFVFTKPVLRYEITDSVDSYFAELYIHTGNAEETVAVSWNNKELLIDETNDYVIRGCLSAEKNSASVDIPAHTTVKIVFFKNDTKKNYAYPLTKYDGTITMPSSSGS